MSLHDTTGSTEDAATTRRVALVEEPHLRLLDGCSSIYELANSAISNGVRLSDLARQRATGDRARL